MATLNGILAKALHSIAEEIEKGEHTCSDEELSSALDDLAKFNSGRGLSKEEACIYMNLSRSTFDTYVRNGWIPRGRKQMGFKELCWNKPDLDVSIIKIRELLKTEKERMFDLLDNYES